ncbi:hypothetical protein HYU15_00580, partial [Candidatus Woesearchaeota archaeon]|nr:hypothetical protein [Candidatus Woesearchaeota archaeon]
MIRAKTFGAALVALALVLALLLVFVKANTDQQAAFLCEKFHENQLDMQQCPAHKSNTSWLLTLAFGAAFLILAIGLYLFLSETQGIAKAALASAVSSASLPKETLDKMSAEEKAVYDAVKQTEGSAYQSDLIKATG